MSKFIALDAVPASVRKPVASSRFAYGLFTKSLPVTVVAGAEARATAIAKSRFVRLPHEPEDARMTGVTRSLNRRLLALSLRGPRFAALLMESSKIA